MFASVSSMVDLFNRDNIATLKNLGYDVTVACNFSEGSVYSESQAMQFRKELIKAGHDVINVPVPRSMFDMRGMINTIRILRNDMKKKKYKLVHCQSPIGGVLCRLAAYSFRKHGMKVIYFAHGFHFYSGAKLINWLAFYSAERVCAKLTDCVITLNREDYLRASRHFPTRVSYVPGVGLDLESINTVTADKESKCEELGIPSDKKIILSVCELSYRKNCEVAVRAFVKSGRKDAVLVLCGIGEQMNMLKSLVHNAGAEDRVFFAGFRNDIIKMFKISDIFIFTTRQEGLPVALMQAMACGLPVLCSEIRGNVDLVKNKRGGYMYDPDNVAGFSDGINRLLDNPKLCRKMGNVNASHILNYDKSVVNEIMKGIYKSVVENE